MLEVEKIEERIELCIERKSTRIRGLLTEKKLWPEKILTGNAMKLGG